MKYIQLTQGQFAIVDDEDYKKLAKHKWCAYWDRQAKSYYAVRGIRLPSGKKTTERMHRRILGLSRHDKREGDHVNHVTLDNRHANLRIVSHKENGHNQLGRGYCFRKRSKKYEAYIRMDGIQKSLGQFDTALDAHITYLFAKAVLHPTAPLFVMV